MGDIVPFPDLSSWTAVEKHMRATFNLSEDQMNILVSRAETEFDWISRPMTLTSQEDMEYVARLRAEAFGAIVWVMALRLITDPES